LSGKPPATVAIFPNPAALLTPPLMGTLNHLLRGQPWLRDRLLPFAGRTAALEVFPAKLMVSVDADGQLLAAGDEAGADVVVRIPVSAVFMLAAGDERARSLIQMSGDPAFAGVLGGVLRELRWDIEEDLSRVVGDIAAHRMVETGRALLDWQGRVAHNVAQTFAEFLTEEKPVLAQRSELTDWVHEVDLVREAVERLEKRIVRLESSRSG
jgi:ubiquinone biosynthesis accessory factor UbiJ